MNQLPRFTASMAQTRQRPTNEPTTNHPVNAPDQLAPRPSTSKPVRATDHAARRYLERIDASEPYPATTLADLWRRVHAGEPLPAFVPGPVVLVADCSGQRTDVVTVYRPDADRSRAVVA